MTTGYLRISTQKPISCVEYFEKPFLKIKNEAFLLVNLSVHFENPYSMEIFFKKTENIFEVLVAQLSF